jgi:hypothetical protein
MSGKLRKSILSKIQGQKSQNTLGVNVPTETCGLYYKHTMIINYASSVISEQSFHLICDARVVIYDRHVFIVQATGPVL